MSQPTTRAESVFEEVWEQTSWLRENKSNWLPVNKLQYFQKVMEQIPSAEEIGEPISEEGELTTEQLVEVDPQAFDAPAVEVEEE